MMTFITGAAGGLGRAIACECARRGYDLFLTDIDDKQLEGIRLGVSRRYAHIYGRWSSAQSKWLNEKV